VLRRASLLGVLGALGVCTSPSLVAAADIPILLPSGRTSLTPGPPLAGASAPTEVLFPRGMTSDERVLVGIDRTGKPVSIVVVQRLKLHKLGDYSFAVPGPIDDVETAPGSDSDPGLRRDAILWAGFSAGTKTLGSRATLRVAPASKLLPLRLSVEREGAALIVRGENTSAARGPVIVGTVSAPEGALALDETRLRLPLGRAAPDLYVRVPRAPRSQSELIAAALDVRIELAGKKYEYRLGDGGPMRFTLRAPQVPLGAKLRLVVTPVPPERQLTPPRGFATWAKAARRGRVPASGLLERLSRIRFATARAFQYQTFLANPDTTGGTHAVYVYETAAKIAAPRPPASPDETGSEAWQTVLFAGLALLGATGLVVLWANS
jgi:hypothetical protein